MAEHDVDCGVATTASGMAKAVSPAKRLGANLGNLRMSERLLTQLQQAPRKTKRYWHVAARLDGVAVGEAPGSAWLVDAVSSGVAWVPAHENGPTAQDRVKKELQDITNLPLSSRAESNARSTALFIPLQDVAKVEPTTTSDAACGVELELLSGQRLEVTFMPGPHTKATYRDEFLELLKERLSTAHLSDSPLTEEDKISVLEENIDGNSDSNSATSSFTAVTQEPSSKTKDTASSAAHNSVPPPKAADATTLSISSRTKEESRSTVEKEETRRLVREYAQLDELSDEAVAIATQVQNRTGYRLGPTSKQLPSFSSDKSYRKKTVIELAEFLKRMNVEWSQADAHRQQYTRASHSRNEDEQFEYTDTETGAQISPQAYERRYLDYVKARDVQPVLYLCPVPERLASEQAETALSQELTTTKGASAATFVKTEDSGAKDTAAAGFLSVLGVDISSSCVIDHEFFASGASSVSERQLSASEDTAQRAAVNHAHAQIWETWAIAFAQLRDSVATADGVDRVGDHPSPILRQELEKAKASSLVHATRCSSTTHDSHQHGQIHGLMRSQSPASRKCARGHRQSISQVTALPVVEDPEVEDPEKPDSECTEAFLDLNASTQTRVKRERPSSLEPGSAHKCRRKSRRQSIVGVVTLPSSIIEEADADEGEKKSIPPSVRTPP